MASVTQLGYVGISAKDVDEWERFSREMLGLQISGRETDGTLFLSDGRVPIPFRSTSHR